MMTLRTSLTALPLLALLAPWLPAREAAAESPVKPYVLLLFDTSGSMLFRVCDNGNVGGDNSAECPGTDVPCLVCSSSGCGNNQPDDNRLFKVKKGAYSVVGAFGEVVFGLARFHQEPDSFQCSRGGWIGAPPDCGGEGLGLSWNRADILVPFADGNHNEILRWMDNCDDYPTAGACPSGVVPGAGGSPATPKDGCAASPLCDECGAGCDRELRANGYTPLAGSLFHFRTTFFPGVLATDPQSACRPYKVVILTDGQNSCPGSAEEQAKLLFQWSEKSIPVHVIGFGDKSVKNDLDEIAKFGGTKEAVIVEDETTLALAMASILSESLLAEVCNGVDDDCDGACDESFPDVAVTDPACSNVGRPGKPCSAGIGACTTLGEFVCMADGSGAACNAKAKKPNPGGEICGNELDDDCDGQTDEGCVPCVAQPEICDGKDNDCDGDVDEGYVSVPCGTEVGQCKGGVTACVGGKVVCAGAKPPTEEICDKKDNNCDSIVDFFTEPCYPMSSGCDLETGTCQGICKLGIHLCEDGKWKQCLGAVGPATEVCNQLDDDCDGEADEGVSNKCLDYSTCTTYNSCQACPGPPDETCDGKDNDCNGKTDDALTDVGKVCGSGVGECVRGKSICVGGQLICQGESPPTPEVCDGKDNDCNSAIDDATRGEGRPCGSDVGTCEPGQTRCIGAKLICVGGTQPAGEICDGKDNDCDGQTDEQAICPGESKCVEGQCVLPCKSAEFACPGGMTCEGGFCFPNACLNVECKEGERCVAGECQDLCADQSCDDHERCDPNSGRCVDDSCVSKGCDDGEACVAYKCVKTDCLADSCPRNQKCFKGQCFDTCVGVTCGAGESCADGGCIKDLCDGKDCPGDQICVVNNGTPRCETDPCLVINCAPGQVCKTGDCIDSPCAYTLCPKGQRCVLNKRKYPTCEIDPTAPQGTVRRVMAAGGGGFSCAVSSAPSTPGAGLLLLLALVLLRRRRRC